MFFSTNEIVDTQFFFAETVHFSLFDASMRTTGTEVEDEDDEDGSSCTYFVQLSSLVGLMVEED